MGPDLMFCELDFKIFLANKKYDVIFGRVDKHTLGCFPWDDAALNHLGADLLDGPPLFGRAASPCNPLPPLKPVYKGDPAWEPLGFRYLTYLKHANDAKVRAAYDAASAEVLAQEEGEEEASLACLGCEEAHVPRPSRASSAGSAGPSSGGNVMVAAVADPLESPAAEAVVASVDAMPAPAGATSPLFHLDFGESQLGPYAQPCLATGAAARAAPFGAPSGAVPVTPIATSGAAAVSASPEAPASSGAQPPPPKRPRQQGSASRVSGQQKSMRIVPHSTPEKEPSTETEITLMTQAPALSPPKQPQTQVQYSLSFPHASSSPS